MCRRFYFENVWLPEKGLDEVITTRWGRPNMGLILKIRAQREGLEC